MIKFLLGVAIGVILSFDLLFFMTIFGYDLFKKLREFRERN